LPLSGVKLLYRDPIGARSIQVRGSKCDFITPERVLTSTESNNRTDVLNFIPFDEPFENRIFEFVGHFTMNDISQLRSKNGIFGKRMQVYRAHCRRYSEMITKFYPRITRRGLLTLPDMRSIVDLQLQCGFDIIAIPEPRVDGDVKEYSKNLTKFSDYVRNRNAEPMPYIDMVNENNIFREKLKAVADLVPNVRCIGLDFRSYTQFYPNFRAVSEVLGDTELWIHASNVPRIHSQMIPLAQAHLPQAYSIDTLALESRQVAAPLKTKQLHRIRKFVEKTLGETRLGHSE